MEIFTHPPRIYLFIIAGLLGVGDVISWGIYGDLLAEKFHPLSIIRSLILGLIYSVCIFIKSPNLPLIIVVLSVIALERSTTELYKALIRTEKTRKYKIPPDFNLHYSHIVKEIAGLVLVVALIYTFIFLDWHLEISRLWLAIGLGFFGATIGMLKDAPYEGLDPLKYFRTPTIYLLLGIIFGNLFVNLPTNFYLLTVVGGERVITEFYKKILNGREPGKFKKKLPINKSWKRNRREVLPIYFLDLMLILFLILNTQL